MSYENGRSRTIDLENMELNPIRRTRFHVNRVDSLEGRASLLGEQETKKCNSLRNLTREALPRLDNYRNILSIQAVHRPTLDELHNLSLVNKGHGTNTLPLSLDQPSEAGIKFGWIQGVLIRCLLNIWGVMLFLRLSWVVAQAGIGEALLLIITTTVVTTITSLSMSAISTNGLIKGGGTYYMISRSLGPEFGGSIGLIFSLANAIACAMYVVGFCESLVACLQSYGVCIVDCDSTDVRIIGCITIVLLLMIVVIGMEWEAKAQLGLLVILLVAIADFAIGTFIGPKDEVEKAKGFVGYSAVLMKENFYPDYRYSEGVDHNFFSVLAIFFPAATGILAGANISGDLKDPQSAIPKGTLLSILLTTISYLLMVVMVGATVLRDASGNVTDLISSVTESPILNTTVTETIVLIKNATIFDNETSTILENGTVPVQNVTERMWSIYGTDFNCTGGCAYGAHNSFQVIELVSFFGPLIYAGCFAATLSSALASLVSAPKVFQALCLDELYPGIAWFSGQPGKEPVRGYILTFVIAVGFILIGELNAIAPLISNFFLAAYTLVNFSTFHASLVKPIGWRPTFKYFNMWLSLAGSILCVAVMFLISWWTALITLSVVLALYLIVSYRKPDVNWGSTTQAQTYNSALTAVQQLDRVEEHVKNYRPQVLVLSGPPSARSVLVDFAHLVTKNHSLLICGHIVESILPHRTRASLVSKSTSWLRANKVKGFYSMIDAATFQEGATAMLQVSGLGKLRPNILLMGYKQDWAVCPREELSMYFNVMHKALDIHVAVALLRVNDGLDYSSIMCDAEQQSTSPRKISSTSMSQNRSFSQLSQELNKYVQVGVKTVRACGELHNLAIRQPLINAESHKVVTRNRINRTPFRRNNIELLASKASPASSSSDISMPGSPAPRRSRVVSEYPNPTTEERKELRQNAEVISKEILSSVTRFQRKQKKGTIDVWWLYDDGGLTLLMPYIISTRSNWSSCKLRVFALANKHSELEYEQRSMASLLSKFRIDYSALTVIPDITKPAQSTTTNFFNLLIADFQQPDDPQDPDSVPLKDSELLAMQEKTNRHLRLREILLENSMEANLIVMTLPMPRKGAVSAPLYMAWLETLTRDMPPFLLVRGNHTSVLTFYS